MQPPTLLRNVLFCLFLLTSVVQNVCLYYGLRVCEQKYIIILCDRLRKSCTTVEQAR